MLSLLLAAFPLGLNGETNAFAKAESVKIVSTRCDIDRKEGIVLFAGRARVDYNPGYTLCADHVFALFTGTNELDRLVAAGHVAVTNGLRRGSCDRAVFRRKTGEIEMSGWPNGRPARLRDESDNTLAGSTIRFWIKGEQVEVTKSELTFNKEGRRVLNL